MRSRRLEKEGIKSLRKGLEEVRKKHENSKASGKNRMKVYILIAIIIALVAVSGYISLTAKVVAESNTVKFAKCLSSAGLTLFGSSDQCEYCTGLKSSLGDGFSYLKYVDCSKEKSQCAAIEEYPTWIYGGQQFNGNFTLQEMSIITKCVL